VAYHLEKVRPDIVVGYESSCLATFRQAKQMELTTILDAASFHHTWQDRFYSPLESPRSHQRIVARKDAEIKLADHILTVSEYARESYIEAGVPPQRVHAIPMGVDLRQFSVRGPEPLVAPNGPMRFIFVGHVDQRKGADVLHEATAQLHGSGRDFRLTVVGNYNSNIRFDDIPCAEHLGWLPQSQLPDVLRRHDVLVLPSRHDSFGMVVAEAMACGLPAVVSDHVGAKEMIESNVSGQIVPAGDAAALAGAMSWLIDHRTSQQQMSAAARHSAESYSWQSYRRRIVALLRRIAQPQLTTEMTV
jgi:glycosyltransferase involved in cell wall biosynthesis